MTTSDRTPEPQQSIGAVPAPGMSHSPFSRRRFMGIAGFAGLAGLGLVAGCGSNETGSSSGSGTTSAAAGTNAGGGSRKKVVVSSWHWEETGGMGDWWKLCKERFEDSHSDIEIEARYVPYNQFFDQAFVELGTGKPADIYSVGTPSNYVMMRNGLAANLDDYVASSAVLQAYSPIIESDWGSTDGSVYVVPMNQLTGSYLYYDKQALEDGGLAVPTTPAEFRAAVEALTDAPTKYGAVLATGTDAAKYFDLLLASMAFGALWWDLDTPRTPTVNTDENIAAMQWYQGFINDQLVPEAADKISHAQLFFEEQAAMMWNGTYSMPQIRANNPELAERTGIAPLPWANGHTWMSALGCIIAERSSMRDEAWQFLEFMSGEEMQIEFAKLTGTPTSYSFPDTSAVEEAMPYLDTFMQPLGVEPLVWRAPTGLEGQAGEFFQIVSDESERFLHAGEEVATVLADIQQKLESLAENAE